MRMVRCLCLLTVIGLIGPAACADPKEKGVWTDPNDPSLPVDFKIQGEYAGDHIGAQVIALGKGTFQAVVLPGGLPGAGWDGKDKILMAGKLDGETAKFEPATGKRKYLAHNPDEFSATSKFPPEGQKSYMGTADGTTLTVRDEKGAEIKLKKTARVSPTMGMKAPAGGIVLFDGTSTAAWDGGHIDPTTKFLDTAGHDIHTKQKFSNYTAHLEFLLPYKPDARDQGRANSGFYQVDQYEVQILDSFGLDGKNNECGGIYSQIAPKVNMCLPPLVWQTYDVEFTNAVNEGGKVVKKARITLKHNGVVVHDNVEIPGKTGGAVGAPEGTPGSFRLQGHGNPVQFRNAWVVEKK